MFNKEITALHAKIAELESQKGAADGAHIGRQHSFIEKEKAEEQIRASQKEIKQLREELNNTQELLYQANKASKSNPLIPEPEIQLDSLIEENQTLKSQLNIVEAELESLQETNKAYKAEITLWEDREKH